MNVSEAAEALGVSTRRVRALIAGGRLSAHRVGSRWEVDVVAATKSRRSLSHRSWGILVQALKVRSLDGVTDHDRTRAAARIRLLRASGEPSSLLADWAPHNLQPTDLFMDTLAALAARSDDDSIRLLLASRPEYLRDPRDLAAVASSERVIRGFDRRQLADDAGVPLHVVADIERRRPLTSPGAVRRVLRALNVEVTALPDMALR